MSTEYQYDLGFRLTALIYRNALGPLGDLQYGYDAAGNRTSVGGSFARTLLPDAITSAAYDQGNRQLAFGPQALTFDDNGNLLTQTDPSGTLTYTWDARNRMTAMVGPSISASFAYDGFGRRAVKTVSGQDASFQYDGLDAVKESNGGTDVAYLRTLSIDEVLARTDTVDTVHFVADALGSTVALADPTGSPTTTYTYEPYGRTEVAGTGSNAFQYTGRDNDGTGLYYYRARYYDPLRSRFVQEDPLGLVSGGVHFYVYTDNNPLVYTDSLGLAPGDWWDVRSYASVGQELNPFNSEGSFARQANSIGQSLGGLIAYPFYGQAALGQVAEAYENSVLGQTKCNPVANGLVKGALAVSTIAAAAALSGGLAEMAGLIDTTPQANNILRVISKPGRWGVRVDKAHHEQRWGHTHFWRW